MNWDHLRCFLWLRWRLTRNQWSRHGPLNAILTLIATIGGVIIAGVGGIAGLILGATTLAQAKPVTQMLVWDILVCGFLFFWVLGVITELQREETLDIGRMLHLPIAPRQVFLLNYAASHMTLSLVIFLPGMIGLTLGLAWGNGGRMLGLLPVLLTFIFMISAWTYCLRGWLISLMANPRRKRTILMLIPIVIVLVAQLPNLYLNVVQRHWKKAGHSKAGPIVSQSREERQAKLPAQFTAVHPWVPPLWVAYGAHTLRERNPWPAGGASAAALLLGAWGLARSYRATLRFYRAEEPGKARAVRSPVAAPAHPRGRTLLERGIPGVPEPAAALAWATFRSYSRAPEIKMQLVSSIVILGVMGMLIFNGKMGGTPPIIQPFLVLGAVASTFLGLVGVLFNQFGYDRDGFRALVLLPVRRDLILLGKNLALLPISIGLTSVYLALLMAGAEISWMLYMAALPQLLILFLVLNVAGNLASILIPYRVSAGSLKPTKAPLLRQLLLMVTHLLFPIAMVPAFVPPAVGLLVEQRGWLPGAPVNLALSLALAGLITWLYWLSLQGLGELLGRREKDILKEVTTEVE